MGNETSDKSESDSNSNSSQTKQESVKSNNSDNSNKSNNSKTNDKKEEEKKRPCCVCKETRAARDLCYAEKGFEECYKEIQEHKDCMAAEGFKI